MERGQEIAFEELILSPEFLSTKEISRYLGITASTIYSLVEQKKIPHYKVGRLVRFKKSQIDQWMERNQVGPADVAKKTLKPRKRPGPDRDVERIVHKSIEAVMGNQYNNNCTVSRTDTKGLGKEVPDGTV